MKIRFLLPAEQELNKAAQYYENQVKNLGIKFISKVHDAIIEIKEYPKAYSIVAPNIRRKIISKFPYAVLYRVDLQEIVIMAIMHMSREPNYWKNRI